jgi:hypothetical protein
MVCEVFFADGLAAGLLIVFHAESEFLASSRLGLEAAIGLIHSSVVGKRLRFPPLDDWVSRGYLEVADGWRCKNISPMVPE